MYCHKCELAYDANARFCDVCGLPLSLNEATPQFGRSPSYPALASSPAKDAEELKGLGGWLILVGIGLLFGVVYRSFSILHIVNLFTMGTVRHISNPHSAGFIPGYTGIVEFEICAQVALLTFTILLAILFVQESRAFPRLWIAFLGLQLIYLGADHWIVSHAVAGSPVQLQQTLRPIRQQALLRIILATIGGTIWIFYAVRSRRVKATFIR
jgi:hypothetical protein